MTDLRSDILGDWLPSALAAFSDAAKDRPGFTRDDDFHLRSLEGWATDAFGFERALFLPTCTMANQIAIRLWCKTEGLIIADARCHIAVNEVISTTHLNGARLEFLESERGHITPSAVEAALGRFDLYGENRSKLVVVENTHNRAGGSIMPAGWMREIATICKTGDVPLHLDGARLWNAATASGLGLSALAAGASSLSVSLNKSIGAPVGALLLGSTDFTEEAAEIQKMFGGLWRPIGALAAAALEAATGFRTRLERDHERARRFADGLRERLPDGSGVTMPETNIVMLNMPEDGLVDVTLDHMSKAGVLAANYGQNRIRFVLHSGIDDEKLVHAIDQTAASVSECISLGRHQN
jgi:threonine aldolase